ncbi:uncharacterized protein LOC123691286 [Colias croceus]|uniref:uncharacterized protein LOC123691286 n=1 Tax=Colias crocea TaxID=72248 RepID=UPI001E27B2B8|nr:uncharacterized protein LOC123691286 [Colias croceus]
MGGRRAASVLPGPLAPISASKTRALTTIYAPRKLKTRKHKTAQSRMLENDITIKPGLSPFHPLPAIGQKPDKTKVIVLDIQNDKPLKFHEVLQPLTPLRIHGFRKTSMENVTNKPQQLLRENTYDVIKPIYVNTNVKKKDCLKKTNSETSKEAVKMSPKTRFKNAALQVAKLTAMSEKGKLLCLRERETYTFCRSENDSCKLQRLPKSPEQKLNELSEIFQNLELKGRQRDRMKKENSWF